MSNDKTISWEGQICFIISPFGGWQDTYYEKIYKPAAEGVGLSCHRADDLFRSTPIMEDIWNYVQSAAVIIADLTGKNPNVFYELGLAHAIGRSVILIASSMDEVPFDLRALRILIYDSKNPHWAEDLRDRISKSLIETLQHPEKAVPKMFFYKQNPPSQPDVSIDYAKIENKLKELQDQIKHTRQETSSYSPPDPFPVSWTREMIEKGMSKQAVVDRLRESFHYSIDQAGSLYDRISKKGY